MTERLRVLVTNDDGISAPGLAALVAAAAENGYLVTVAAPNAEFSGTSAAITAVEDEGRVLVEQHEFDGNHDIRGFSVAASPAFIVLLALREAFGPPPELVLSGVNRGANTGRVVLHSGTVGAALTAAVAGLRGMAISLDMPGWDGSIAGDGARHWATAARVALTMVPLATSALPGTVLNVNSPDVPFESLSGTRRTRLARFGQVQMTLAETGEGFIRTAVKAAEEPPEPGTDLAAIADGYASVTAIRWLDDASDVDLGPLTE